MLKRIFLAFLSLIIFAISFAQQEPAENKPQAKPDTAVIEAIPLADLSDALNSAQKDLIFFKNQLSELPTLADFDSIYSSGKARLDNEKQLLMLNEKQFGQREISDATKEWKNYADKINKYLAVTNNSLSSIEVSLQETDTMFKTWTLTLAQLRENDINYALRTTAIEVVKQIQEIQREIKQKQNDILIKQDKLNNLLFDVNDVLFSLQNEAKQIKSEYFLRASLPIWKFKENRKESLTVKESLQSSVKRHKKNFEIFYSAYQHKFGLHIFIFIMLVIGLYYLNNIYQLQPDENKVLYQNSKEVTSRYILSSLIIAVLLSIWIYPTRQNAVNDLLQ